MGITTLTSSSGICPSRLGRSISFQTALGCCQPPVPGSGVRQRVKSFKWGEGCSENAFSGSKTSPVPVGLLCFYAMPPVFQLSSPVTVFLPQAPRTAQRELRGHFPWMEGGFPSWGAVAPSTQAPGRCSSLKDVGMRCRQQAATDEVAFLSVLWSDKRPAGLHACQPPGSSGCLWLARQNPREPAGGRKSCRKWGARPGYVQALVPDSFRVLKRLGERLKLRCSSLEAPHTSRGAGAQPPPSQAHP